MLVDEEPGEGIALEAWKERAIPQSTEERRVTFNFMNEKRDYYGN